MLKRVFGTSLVAFTFAFLVGCGSDESTPGAKVKDPGKIDATKVKAASGEGNAKPQPTPQ